MLRLVDINEFKRQQAPPTLRVSAKAFGSGRQMPIAQRWRQNQFEAPHMGEPVATQIEKTTGEV
jgi:hypothetical protein